MLFTFRFCIATSNGVGSPSKRRIFQEHTSRWIADRVLNARTKEKDDTTEIQLKKLRLNTHIERSKKKKKRRRLKNLLLALPFCKKQLNQSQPKRNNVEKHVFKKGTFQKKKKKGAT